MLGIEIKGKKVIKSNLIGEFFVFVTAPLTLKIFTLAARRSLRSIPSLRGIAPRYIAVHRMGASEITANPYCNCVYLYWEGCAICSIHLR